jgi:hypothetical protein
MKKNFIYFSVIAATMMFAACASNDVEEANNGSTDGTGAKLEIGLDQSTRVTTEADATNGVLTKWSDNEKINSYHKYKNKGVAQSLMTLPFTNQSGNVQNGLFTYTNSGTTNDYRFNSGNMIYLFNNLNSNIASNYTVAANTSTSVFTLTLKNLQNQTGTVAGLAAYDGMYGTLSAAAVNDAKTVGPANTHHLTSVIRFDLTNADFANNTVSNINMWNAPSSKNMAYTTTTSAKAMTSNAIIPSSGAFTLNADGTLAASPTLTGYSKWSPADVTASSGTASAYLMTLPFQNVTGTLFTINVKCGANYYERQLWLNGMSLTSGGVTTKKVTLNRVTQCTDITDLYWYAWDAPVGQTYTYPTGVTYPSSGTSALRSCANCPTLNQIKEYLGAGVYWDYFKGWIDKDGNLQHGGIWLKKISVIEAEAAAKGTTPTLSSSVTPGDWVKASGITRSDYFFLPAKGYYFSNDYTNITSFLTGGCRYWSSTSAFSGGSNPYALDASYSSVIVTTFNEKYTGFCLWTVQ